MTITSQQLFNLAGKRAFITGSSQGIGLSLARALASAGATIVLNGRDKEKLLTAQQLLLAEGYQVEYEAFDVTNADEVHKGISNIEANGPIDILVNNAGIQIRGAFTEFKASDWDRLVATNLTSAFLVGQAVALKMLPRKSGKIINVCSVQSELGRPTIAPYTATKGGLKMLTKGMAIDLGPHGIQVNGLGPGYFDTELTSALVKDPVFTGWIEKRVPAGRWGNTEELSGAVIFLAAPASNFVNGHILYVDGGMTASL
jgi:gluconate 5-dehydrogenase